MRATTRGYEGIATPLAIANGPPPALALTLASEGTLHEIGGAGYAGCARRVATCRPTLVGLGLPYATNAYNASLSSPFPQQFNERYGLQPASLTLSAMLHL